MLQDHPSFALHFFNTTINGQFFIHFILIAFPIKKPKTNFMYQVQTEIFIEPRYLLSDSKLETWPKPTIFKDGRGE